MGLCMFNLGNVIKVVDVVAEVRLSDAEMERLFGYMKVVD